MIHAEVTYECDVCHVEASGQSVSAGPLPLMPAGWVLVRVEISPEIIEGTPVRMHNPRAAQLCAKCAGGLDALVPPA